MNSEKKEQILVEDQFSDISERYIAFKEILSARNKINIKYGEILFKYCGKVY